VPTDLSQQILWARRDKIQTTDCFSYLLGKVTETHLHVGLAVATWRHIAIAIERDVVRDFVAEGFDRTETSANDLRANHTESIAQQHYGIRSHHLVQLTSGYNEQV